MSRIRSRLPSTQAAHLPAIGVAGFLLAGPSSQPIIPRLGDSGTQNAQPVVFLYVTARLGPGRAGTPSHRLRVCCISSGPTALSLPVMFIPLDENHAPSRKVFDSLAALPQWDLRHERGRGTTANDAGHQFPPLHLILFQEPFHLTNSHRCKLRSKPLHPEHVKVFHRVWSFHARTSTARACQTHERSRPSSRGIIWPAPATCSIA